MLSINQSGMSKLLTATVNIIFLEYLILIHAQTFFVAWFLLSRLVPASMSSIKAGLPKRFCLNTLSTTTWPALCASSTCVCTFTRHHRNQAVCLLMGRVAFSYDYDPCAMLKRIIVTEKYTFFLYLKWSNKLAYI